MEDNAKSMRRVRQRMHNERVKSESDSFCDLYGNELAFLGQMDAHEIIGDTQVRKRIE